MVLQYNDSTGPAAGEEIIWGERKGGRGQNLFTQEQDEKVPMCVMACVRVCAV